VSNRALNAVIDGLPPSSIKPVLVILANRAGKESGGCFIGMDTLAYETGFSIRFVRNAIRALEAAGWLRTVRGGGFERANFYVIAVDRLEPLAAAHREQQRRRRDGGAGEENPAPRAEYREAEPGTDREDTRHEAHTYSAPEATYSARGAHTRHVVPPNLLEPRRTSEEELLSALTRGEEGDHSEQGTGRLATSQRSEHAEGFEAFWSAYPRRVARAAAAKAWNKAVTQADPDAIISGATRYAAAREGQDPKYTAHPATWLNGARWLDQPDPPSPETHSERRARLHKQQNDSLAWVAAAFAAGAPIELDAHTGLTIDGTASPADPPAPTLEPPRPAEPPEASRTAPSEPARHPATARPSRPARPNEHPEPFA
jgi:hypothetical protein